MFDFLYDIEWQALTILISLFAGWYFGSSLYGRMPLTKSMWGSAYDNPLHFVVYWLIGRREPPVLISWVLFVAHVPLMLASVLYVLLGVIMAFDIEVMLWYFLVLPYSAACFLRWFITKQAWVP
jgi:hypothetical protein